MTSGSYQFRGHGPKSRQRRGSLAASMLGLAIVACGGAGSVGPGQPGELTRRDTRILHEECDLDAAGAKKYDVNSDGTPDITVIRSGSVEKCRAVDLNFDGTIDSWTYRDASGAVTRREYDYDRDGRVDEIALYKGGVLVEKHRATTLAGKLDTWHFYQAGKLARTERDSDGDAVIDQWWEYPKAAEPSCPLIHSDVDGDGRPDPGATVDVCGEQSGYVPPEKAEPGQASGGSFERADPNSVPTEVETKPAEPGPAESGGEEESK